jgi:chromosome partitioning protein
VSRKNLHKEVDRQRDIYDWIVIDGTPRDDAITRSCLIAADLVIIPIEPSALSAWASDRIVGQVEEARIYRPDLRAYFVISRKITGTILG